MRPIVELIRLEEDEIYGTFGVLKINKKVFCVTLEPPDKENQQSVSSIPVQQYICRRYSSAKYPSTFQVTNVPSRTKVLFHAGNTVDHTMGCILLGQYFGKLSGNRAVLNSGKTFNDFMAVLSGVKAFHLTVKEMY